MLLFCWVFTSWEVKSGDSIVDCLHQPGPEGTIKPLYQVQCKLKHSVMCGVWLAHRVWNLFYQSLAAIWFGLELRSPDKSSLRFSGIWFPWGPVALSLLLTDSSLWADRRRPMSLHAGGGKTLPKFWCSEMFTNEDNISVFLPPKWISAVWTC